MMGTHHAISGAAAWIAITSATPVALGIEPLSTPAVLIGAVVTAGAALLPDVDHHNGTIAHSGGLATKAIAGVAQVASGGHRHGLHGLLAIAGFYIATMFLGRFTMDVPYLGEVAVGSAVLLMALIAFALKALKISKGGKIKLWMTALVATLALVYFAPEQLEWLPLSVMVGVATHLAGDFITTGGLPLLWPISIKPPRALKNVPVISSIWKSNGYISLPILGDTGSVREWVLCAALSVYVAAGIVLEVMSALG